jgi:protein SCO1/2
MIVSVLSFIMVLIPAVAGASPQPPMHVHGVVLGLTPDRQGVIVRHDAFGGMPAMTMPFAVLPRGRAAELQTGAIIDADADMTTNPWTLRNVKSTAAESLTSVPGLRHVAALRVGDYVPDQLPFVDQNGNAFSFAQLRGQDVVLAFIYTRCQDARMCPLISGKFHQLQTQMGARKMHLVEITLDPTYDRPPVLARYGRMFGADPKRWTLAVGNADATLDFAARFGVSSIPDPNIGIIHSEDTVIIGPDDRIEQMISENAWTADEILAQIDASRHRASNPFERFNLYLSEKAWALCGNNQSTFNALQDVSIVVIILALLWIIGRRLWRMIFVENI